jgi:protein-disulfide isomerase
MSNSADSRRRLYQLGALLVTAAVLAVVALAAFTGSGTPPLAPGKPVPGASQTASLFAGIPQSGITLGFANAPVTLVEFGDLQCPYCAVFAEKALPSIVARYVRSGRVQLVFHNLDGLGSDSVRAAQMAGALGKQDHLWQFVDLAYRNQRDENSGYVTENFLRAIAQAIAGVNANRAMNERGSPSIKAQIAQATNLAHQLKLNKTPSFLLGATGQPGRVFSPEGLDSGSFTSALDRLLRSVGG